VFIILSEIKQLIQASQKGQLSAFDELVVLYQDRVYSHCVHLTGHTEDAYDLAQEVFLRAYRSISSFRGDADFGTWLHRIAVNLWINERKRARNRLLVLPLDEPIATAKGEVMVREFESDAPTPEEQVEQRELMDRLRSALTRVPEEFRLVLILRDIEGYSYQDIADMTGHSLGTVKSRLSRGRNLLKKLLTGLDL
jgi:RNA polymerase sigma-70 factor (ECF subfamily)